MPHRVAPQVEIAVVQPERLVDAVVVELERQHRRGVEHVEALDVHLDLAGRKPRVHRLGRPAADDTLRLDDELGAERVRAGVRLGLVLGVEHELHEARLVAEIDEDEPAVVAPARDPAGDRDAVALVRRPQIAAHVRPVGHVRSSSTSRSSATRRCSPVVISRSVASPAAHSSSPTMTTVGMLRLSASSSARLRRRPP